MILAILLYAIFMGTYVFMRPSLSYTTKGQLRTFGMGPSQTLFPLWVVSLLSATIIAFIYSLFNGSAEVVELTIIE